MVTPASNQSMKPTAPFRNKRSVFATTRSEEHTSELQSQSNLVCRLLLEKTRVHVRRMLALDSRLHCHRSALASAALHRLGGPRGDHPPALRTRHYDGFAGQPARA